MKVATWVFKYERKVLRRKFKTTEASCPEKAPDKELITLSTRIIKQYELSSSGTFALPVTLQRKNQLLNCVKFITSIKIN